MAIDFRDYIKNTQALTEGIELINKLIEGVEKGAKTTKKDGGLINEKQTKKAQEWNAALKEMVANYEHLQKVLGTYVEQVKKVEQAQAKKNKKTIEEIEHLKQLKQAERLNARVRLTQVGTIENIRAKLALVTHEWARLTKVEGYNTSETKKLAAEKLRLTQILKQVESATGDNRRNVGNYASAWGRLKNSIVSVSQAAGVFFGIMGAVRLFKNYIQIIRDFEKTNATLAGVLQVSKDQMKGLTEESIRLSRITVKRADEIAQLQVSYARLGFVQEEIIALTEATIQGSIALNAELDETALLTGAMVKTFQEFTVNDAAEVMDVMALVTAKSALNFEKLQKALPIVGGAANAAGLSFSRTAALLGKLADSGIDVSTSATAIRNILIRASKAGMNYNEMLDLVAKSSNKLTTAANAMGVRAAVSGTILAENLDGIRELDLALIQAQGTMQSMADKELDTLDGAIKLVNSAWQGYILDSARAHDYNGKLKVSLQFLAKNLGKVIDNVIKAGKAWAFYYGALKARAIWQNLLIANEARIATATSRSAAASIADAAAKGAQTAATSGLVTAQGAAIASTVTATGVTGVFTTVVNLATTAWLRFQAALKANWIGIAAAALYYLYTVLDDINHEMDEFERRQMFAEFEASQIAKYVTPHINKLTELTNAVKDNVDNIEKRTEAVKAFNEQYGTTIDATQEEEELLIDLAEAYRDLTQKIKNEGMAEALAAEISGVNFELDQLKQKIEKGEIDLQFGVGDKEQLDKDKKAFEELTNQVAELEAKLTNVRFLINGGGKGKDPTEPIFGPDVDEEEEKKRAKLREKIKADVAKMYRKGAQADIDSKKQQLKRDKDFITDKEYYERSKALLLEQYNFDKSLDTLSDADKRLLEEMYITDSYALWDDYYKGIKKLRDKDAKEDEKTRKQNLKDEEEAQKKRRREFEISMNYILDGVQQMADQRVVESERFVTQAQQNVELQNQRAVAGLANTLSEQQRLLAKAEKERALATKRAAQAEKARSLFAAYSGYAKSDSTTALAKTLKDFAILEAISAVASFGEGGIVAEHSDVKSGVLRGPSHKSKKGGIPILAEGNEGILSVKAMRNLGRENFHQIMTLAEKGKVDENVFSKQLKQHNTIMVETGLKEEMVKTRKAIESKPEISAPEIIKGMLQITETRRKGNLKTRNNYRIKKPRL